MKQQLSIVLWRHSSVWKLNTSGLILVKVKKIMFAVILLLPCFSFAQDKIYKTDNTIIDVKVTDVTDDVIKYKKFSNLDGPTYNVKKTELKMIVYENGEKEMYTDIPVEINPKENALILNKLLSENKTYFSSSELRENGSLYLTATEKYNTLSSSEKKVILAKITKAKGKALVMVKNESKRELWNYNYEIENAQLLDEWDLNATQLVTQTPKTIYRPWFAYIGGQIGGTKNNAGATINLRIGFFLLKNRWDLAASISGGATENLNIENEPTVWSNFGLLSRVHFPIKKLHMSPNIGAEISVNTFGSSQTKVTPSAVVGVSWFIGCGSLDIGVRLGDVVTGMGGYSVTPHILNR